VRHPRSRSDIILSRASALLILGNLLDALFTYLFLQMNLVSEANPLMAWAYESSPVSFMLLKLSSVQLGVLLLWLHRHVVAAQVALQAAAGLYVAIVAYHFTLMVRLPI
jgi:hypothetical protein